VTTKRADNARIGIKPRRQKQKKEPARRLLLSLVPSHSTLCALLDLAGGGTVVHSEGESAVNNTGFDISEGGAALEIHLRPGCDMLQDFGE